VTVPGLVKTDGDRVVARLREVDAPDLRLRRRDRSDALADRVESERVAAVLGRDAFELLPEDLGRHGTARRLDLVRVHVRIRDRPDAERAPLAGRVALGLNVEAMEVSRTLRSPEEEGVSLPVGERRARGVVPPVE